MTTTTTEVEGQQEFIMNLPLGTIQNLDDSESDEAPRLNGLRLRMFRPTTSPAGAPYLVIQVRGADRGRWMNTVTADMVRRYGVPRILEGVPCWWLREDQVRDYHGEMPVEPPAPEPDLGVVPDGFDCWAEALRTEGPTVAGEHYLWKRRVGSGTFFVPAGTPGQWYSTGNEPDSNWRGWNSPVQFAREIPVNDSEPAPSTYPDLDPIPEGLQKFRLLRDCVPFMEGDIVLGDLTTDGDGDYQIGVPPGHPYFDRLSGTRSNLPRDWSGRYVNHRYVEVVTDEVTEAVVTTAEGRLTSVAPPEGARLVRVLRDTSDGRRDIQEGDLFWSLPHNGTVMYLVPEGENETRGFRRGHEAYPHVPQGWRAYYATNGAWGYVGDSAESVTAFDRSEVERLASELAAAQAQLTEAQAEARVARERHESDFQAVAEIMRDEAENRDWCSEYEEVITRINRATHLDLPHAFRERDYSVQFSGQGLVNFTVSLTVQATDEEEAVAEARRRLDVEAFSNFNLEVDRSSFEDPSASELTLDECEQD